MSIVDDRNHRECVSILNCILTGGTAHYRKGRNTDFPITIEEVMNTPLSELFGQWDGKIIFTHRERRLHDRILYGVQKGDVWTDNNNVVRTIDWVFDNGTSFRDFNRNESRVDCLVSLLYRKGLKE